MMRFCQQQNYFLKKIKGASDFKHFSLENNYRVPCVTVSLCEISLRFTQHGQM